MAEDPASTSTPVELTRCDPIHPGPADTDQSLPATNSNRSDRDSGRPLVASRPGVVRRVVERPEVIVALAGCAFVVFQWWWVRSGRFFGAMDTDEGGAISTSLAFHRALAVSPGALYRAALGSGTGPLVPVMSIPFTVLFGRSATSPMLVQPVLVVLTAIGVAGAVAQLAGRRAALVAGACTFAMPALITSSRTDQFGTGVSAFMCLAVWALLASDRGRRTWAMAGFGAACGAMTIARTMSVSFLPAMGAAALCVLSLRRGRTWLNIGVALVAVLAVAARWWWAQWDFASTYLRTSGYGGRAGFYGSGAIMGRLSDHVEYLLKDFHAFLPVGAFIGALAVVEGARAWRGEGRSWVIRNRDLVAVWAAYLMGTLALLTSSNRGFWFGPPLDALLVIAVVASGARVLGRTARPTVSSTVIAVLCASVITNWAGGVSGMVTTLGLVVLAVAVGLMLFAPHRSLSIAMLAVVLCVATLLASAPRVGPSPTFANDRSLRGQLVSGLEPYLPTVYESDPRLLSSDLRVRRRVAGEWAAAARELDRRLVSLEDTMSINGSGTLEEIVTGSRGLFESNTVGVARELGLRAPRWLISPNTLETTDAQISESLGPKAPDGTPRLLIVIEGRAAPFPDAIGWERFVRLAEARRWKVQSTIRLPDLGKIVIYEHPDNLQPVPAATPPP
jgi:4-amino-4-deoxy-L-arabinose transferase-like glycosyltransferase